MTGAELNRAVEEARDAIILELTEPLAAAYAKVLRRFGRKAKAAYLTASGGAVLAAARADELYDPDELAADVKRDTARLRRSAVERMVEGVLTSAGVSFDVAPLLVPALLDHIGIRARDLDRSMADSLRKTIETASAQGWTVPETAAEIQAGVYGMAGYTAEALARTDLIGLANGGSIVAAREVMPPGSTKTWLATPDDRTRETHVEADGQTVPIDAQFDVGGELLDYPGDPSGSDEEVINCRCTVLYDEAAAEPVLAAAGPDVSGLAMVAVYPTAEQAANMAPDGGAEPDTLHVTMVFLGDVADIDLAAADRAVQAAAAETAAMEGSVGGVGLFAAGPDGHPQLALPNVPGLSALRATVVAALADEGIESPSEHDWVPHMTLGYVEEPELPDLAVVGADLTFASLSLVVEDNRTDYDFQGAVTASATHEEEGTMKGSVNMELTAGAPEVRIPILANGEIVGHASGTFGTAASGAAAFTVTRDTTQELAAADGEEPTGTPWVSDIAFEGTATGDGRWIKPGGLTWREPPLTLMAQTVTDDGHDGAMVAGRMDTFARDTKNDMNGGKLPEGVTAIRSTGVFDDAGDTGADIARMVDDETLRGVSVDLSISEWAFRDPDTGEILDPDEMSEADWERAFFGELEYAILAAEIMATTVCPTPAFADARIAVVTASADGDRQTTCKLWAPIRLAAAPAEVITASAAGHAPLHPPLDWFKRPTFTGLTPKTVTDDGHVYGHFAGWNSCHVGKGGCLQPPRVNDLSMFMQGSLTTAEGDDIAVGTIVMDTDHGDVSLTAQAARRRYDDTGLAVADVVVGMDEFGYWFSGAIRPDLSDEKRRAFKAANLSGDWRPVQGQHQLTGILTCNLPGFTIPRPQAVVLASGDDSDEVGTVLAAGFVLVNEGDATDAIRMRVLAARAEGGLPALAEIAR